MVRGTFVTAGALKGRIEPVAAVVDGPDGQPVRNRASLDRQNSKPLDHGQKPSKTDSHNPSRPGSNPGTAMGKSLVRPPRAWLVAPSGVEHCVVNGDWISARARDCALR